MDLDILTIENGKVIPSLSCYTVPELKAIIDNYKDPIQPLCYLYYRTYPKSPYANVPDYEKDDVILGDFQGDYSPEDEFIRRALDKLNVLYITPTRRFFENAKKGLDTLGEYLATSGITDGKDGNLSTFSTTLSRIGKTMQEFKQLEKIYEEDLGSGLRGSQELSFDE